MFLLLPLSHSLNLGSFVKNDHVEIKENETGIFEIILWSSDKNYTIFLQEKNVPENIKVNIEPRIIKESKDEIYIAREDGVIKAHKVKIFVESLNAKPGEYYFSVLAYMHRQEEKIGVIQEREFNFKVVVLSNYTDVKSYVIKTGEQERQTKMFEIKKDHEKIIIFLAIFLTAIIVFLIIKRH